METYYDQEFHDKIVITFKRLPKADAILQCLDELNLQKFSFQNIQEICRNWPCKLHCAKPVEGEAPQIPEEEAMKAARKVAFNNAKQNLQKQLVDGVSKLKESALEALAKELPTEEEMTIIKKSSGGKDYIKMLEDAKAEVAGYTLSL